VLAQPTTPPARPAQTTPRPTTPASGTASGNAKPVDLCADFIDGACLGGTDQYATGDGRTIITNLTTNIVSWLIFIGAAIAVFFIVLGGYKVITSNGDDKTAKEGKDMVLNSLIGLIIMGLSFTLVTLVVRFVTGLNIGTP